jgi:hypothetical protein
MMEEVNLSHFLLIVLMESEQDTVFRPFFENQSTIVDFPDAFLPVKPISIPVPRERTNIVLTYLLTPISPC